MHVIMLDASRWATIGDFYRALLQSLGAPTWHGCNANALIESMVHYDDINAVAPPYGVRIINTRRVPRDVQEELSLLTKAIPEARDVQRRISGRDTDIRFDLEP